VYYLLLKALSRVANDRHECKGHLGRALGWGAFWSALYTLPLALAVWGVHAILRARGG
jgi:hypothetical protein